VGTAAFDGAAPNRHAPTANMRTDAAVAALGFWDLLRAGFFCWKRSNVFPVRSSSTVLMRSR
jgi:hypothetical protein